MDVVARNNIQQRGNPSGQPMLFAHGFGCDQNMWRLVIATVVVKVPTS
jgi:sigma-B regulation protein RsbQ